MGHRVVAVDASQTLALGLRRSPPIRRRSWQAPPACRSSRASPIWWWRTSPCTTSITIGPGERSRPHSGCSWSSVRSARTPDQLFREVGRRTRRRERAVRDSRLLPRVLSLRPKSERRGLGMAFNSYHHPLEAYSLAPEEAGFVIEAILQVTEDAPSRPVAPATPVPPFGRSYPSRHDRPLAIEA